MNIETGELMSFERAQTNMRIKTQPPVRASVRMRGKAMTPTIILDRAFAEEHGLNGCLLLKIGKDKDVGKVLLIPADEDDYNIHAVLEASGHGRYNVQSLAIPMAANGAKNGFPIQEARYAFRRAGQVNALEVTLPWTIAAVEPPEEL